MRLLVAVLACVLVASHARVADVDHTRLSGVIDNKGGQLVGFLEKLKETLKHGNENIGIPVLDPLKQQHLNVNLNQQGLIRLQGGLDDLLVTGLSEYKVNRGDFAISGIKANVSLFWDEIDITVKYNANGTLVDSLSFYGNGDLALSIQGLAASVDLNLKMVDKKFTVDQLVLHAHVQKLNCDITGLYNDDELSAVVSKAIGEITPGLIEDYQSKLSTIASPIVANAMNRVLKNMTLKDILDMIFG